MQYHYIDKNNMVNSIVLHIHTEVTWLCSIQTWSKYIHNPADKQIAPRINQLLYQIQQVLQEHVYVPEAVRICCLATSVMKLEPVTGCKESGDQLFETQPGGVYVRVLLNSIFASQVNDFVVVPTWYLHSIQTRDGLVRDLCVSSVTFWAMQVVVVLFSIPFRVTEAYVRRTPTEETMQWRHQIQKSAQQLLHYLLQVDPVTQ